MYLQLGGTAEGSAHAVAGRSSFDGYARATTLTEFGRQACYASEQATFLQEADTAAIFSEIGRGID